jgi:hypothetical protein
MNGGDALGKTILKKMSYLGVGLARIAVMLAR